MARRVAVMPVALVAAAFLLSACGSSTGDRGLSGAGIGAAAGTAVGVVTGLSIVEGALIGADERSEEHTSELQSLMRISYDVFRLKKQTHLVNTPHDIYRTQHNIQY